MIKILFKIMTKYMKNFLLTISDSSGIQSKHVSRPRTRNTPKICNSKGANGLRNPTPRMFISLVQATNSSSIGYGTRNHV